MIIVWSFLRITTPRSLAHLQNLAMRHYIGPLSQPLKLGHVQQDLQPLVTSTHGNIEHLQVRCHLMDDPLQDHSGSHPIGAPGTPGQPGTEGNEIHFQLCVVHLRQGGQRLSPEIGLGEMLQGGIESIFVRRRRLRQVDWTAFTHELLGSSHENQPTLRSVAGALLHFLVIESHLENGSSSSKHGQPAMADKRAMESSGRHPCYTMLRYRLCNS